MIEKVIEDYDMARSTLIVAYGSTIGESIKRCRRERTSQNLATLANQEDPLFGVSRWVLNTIEEVSNFLGMSFEGVERQAWELFMG